MYVKKRPPEGGLFYITKPFYEDLLTEVFFVTVYYVTNALRCNGFVAGPNSAGSFYVSFYYTLY